MLHGGEENTAIGKFEFVSVRLLSFVREIIKIIQFYIQIISKDSFTYSAGWFYILHCLIRKVFF